MRLAIIRRVYLGEGGGGAERHARSLCQGLAELGHSLTLFAEKRQGDLPPNASHRSVPECLLPRSSGTTAFHAAASRTFRKTVDADSFDSTLALSRVYPADVFRSAEQIHADWLPRNKPWWQRLNPRHIGILSLERQIYNPVNTGLVVAPSSLAKQEILAHYKFPADRIRVVWNGVDRKQFFPSSSPDERACLRRSVDELAGFHDDGHDSVLLLFAGSFAIKGLDAAIAAIAKSGFGEHIRLVVAGAGEPAPFLAMAAAAGLAGRVSFVGQVKEMRTLYAAADLLVHPSLGEPFANVCVEAAACGTPSLTTAVNGSAEVFSVGGAYIVPTAADVAGMASVLGAFTSMSDDERAASHAAAFRASAPLSWEAHARKFEDVLLESAEMRKRKS